MPAKDEAEKWKEGDLVVLKSGGPVMTVSGADAFNGDVDCVWFAGKKREAARFDPKTLRRATDDDK